MSARDLPSEFAIGATRPCMVDSALRCVPADVFRRLDVSFPTDAAFLAARSGPLSVPVVDAGILDALFTDPELSIAGTLEIFRGQTADDGRPNKALRPWLYRVHLASYPKLPLMCDIAEHGVIPPWIDPVGRWGVRPVPDNYIGAITGASIVTNKLLADYYKGRCLIASLDTLQADPGFHSSSLHWYQRRTKPFTWTVGSSTIYPLPWATPSMTTPIRRLLQMQLGTCLSQSLRICDLCRRDPGCAIYAMVADIADAFHHVPVYARHASAFGGKLPRSAHGIVSGMAVFGWTSSPGFFAVFGKAVRHYQRTGSSRVQGYEEPFWIFQWVDDIVLIEVDIDDRLHEAEKRLRGGVKLVFGSEGWHKGKFTIWSCVFHAVGIDWKIPDEIITVPQRKIDKLRRVIEETMTKKFIALKQLDSLVGVLRHVISFIPVTKPFIQRLVAVQNRCRKRHKAGVPMTEFLQKDLVWWKHLTFESEFAGIPLRLLDYNDDVSDI